MTYFSTSLRIKSSPTLHHFPHSTTTDANAQRHDRVSETELCELRNVTSHWKHITLIHVKCHLLSVCGHAFLHMRIHDMSVCLRPFDKHTEKLQRERQRVCEREKALLLYWLRVQARLTPACIFKKSRPSTGTPGSAVTAADRMTILFTVVC